MPLELKTNYSFPRRPASSDASGGDAPTRPPRSTSTAVARPPRTTSRSVDLTKKEPRHSRGSSLSAALLSRNSTSTLSLTGLTEKEEDLFNDPSSKYRLEEPWEFKDEDDQLHAPTPTLPQQEAKRGCSVPTVHGYVNLLVLCVIAATMLGVFLALPIASYFEALEKTRAFQNRVYAWNVVCHIASLRRFR
jgi:hypothetical protein